MKISVSSLLLIGVLIGVATPGARALSDNEAAGGRLVARRYADAVVGVKASLFMKFKIGLQTTPQTERKIDLSGTMIDASGTTVTALSVIDPKAIFDAMRGQMNAGAEPVELGQTEYRNIRFRLGDGTEIPARIVWKDPQHDLVVLSPDGAAAKNHTFTFVELSHATESASLQGTYFALSRAGDEFQRVPLLRASTVEGIIDRPRRLLLVNSVSYPDTLGCPVFDIEGRVLGICLRNVDKGTPKSTVVVPASDLASIIAAAAPE